MGIGRVTTIRRKSTGPAEPKPNVYRIFLHRFGGLED